MLWAAAGIGIGAALTERVDIVLGIEIGVTAAIPVAAIIFITERIKPTRPKGNTHDTRFSAARRGRDNPGAHRRR